MASWDADAKTTHPVDFRLVQNTFVTMFWRSSLLGETVGWLRLHGYEVAQFDAGSWASAGGMFDDLAERLQFPSYFGRNLDALNDCMRDVASHEYGWHADATGLVIVLSAIKRVVMSQSDRHMVTAAAADASSWRRPAQSRDHPSAFQGWAVERNRGSRRRSKALSTLASS